MLLIITASQVIISLLLVTVINWKMPRKRAARWSSPLLSIVYLTHLYFIRVMFFHGRMFPGFEPIQADRSNMLILPLVTFFFAPAFFFASEYMQYRKDKTDIENLRETIKGAVGYNILVLIAAIIVILDYLFWWADLFPTIS